MPCAHCRHCSAEPVLRLPESRNPDDTAAYDGALLAAHSRAGQLSSQPVRLLLDVNPWLTRAQLRDQLRRAHARGATPAPDSPDQAAVQALLDSRLWAYSRRVSRHVLTPDAVVENGLAPDHAAAAALLAVALAAQS